MNVLVLNCGSSTVKFQVIATDREAIQTNSDRTLASGVIERIGSQALVTLRNLSKHKTTKDALPIKDHRSAIRYVLNWIVSEEAQIEGIASLADVNLVGHRIVHGGELFTHSTVLSEDVLRSLEDMIDLAPLHNPANIAGVRAVREVLGTGIPQVGVFDTAFHHTLPDHAYLYAVPYQLYRRYKIRRYGFHGTSHRYVAYRYRQLRGIDRSAVFAVSLHLGNGASACAIVGGNSEDTSMGMTPLEGLVMGTRSGDLDPALIEVIAQKEGMTFSEVVSYLNRDSGLLGISGLTNDMRELLEEERENQDRRARLAIEIFCYRARKYIGAYLTSIASARPGLDQIAILFTGGIGENSPEIRARILEGMEWFGLSLDGSRNNASIKGKEGLISSEDGKLTAWVIATNEELLIARDTVRAVS